MIRIYGRELLCGLFIFIGMLIFAGGRDAAGQAVMLGTAVLWTFDRMRKGQYTLYELLLFMVIGFFAGSNYLLWFGVVINGVYIGRALRRGMRMKMDLETAGFALMFCTGILSSALNAADKQQAGKYTLIYGILFLFLCENKAICREVRTEENAAVRLFCMASFLLGAGFFITHSVTELWTISRAAIFYNTKQGIASNTLAGIMAPFVFGCALVALEAEDAWTRILAVLSVGMMLPVLFAIQSRGAYLGIFMAIIWNLCAGRKSLRSLFYMMIAVIILTIVVMNHPWLVSRLFGRFVSVVQRTGSSLNGRERLYKIAWNMFREHPVIGNGFWQFYVNQISEQDPHNFLLSYFASAGIVGGAGFLAYLAAIYKRWQGTFKRQDKNAALVCKIMISAYIIFIIHGCVEPVLTTQAPLAAFILMTSLPAGGTEDAVWTKENPLS